MKRAPLPTESQEQCAVISWWALYCKTKGLHENLLFMVPNGSVLAGDARGRAIQMARLKREGLRKGAPDLMLATPKFDCPRINGKFLVNLAKPPVTLFFGLFVEMKRIGEKARPEQIVFADMLRRQGYSVVIAQGADEAIRAINGYLAS